MSNRAASPDKPLRVVHVIGGLHLGGAETLLYRLVTGDRSNTEHQVICLGEREWYSPLLEQHGIPVCHLGMTRANFVPRLLALRKLIRDSGAGVVQSWLYVANLLSGIAARASRIPVVWGIHASSVDDIDGISRACALAGGHGARWLADFVIYCSSCSAETHALRGYAAVPGAVVHNGYNPDVFRPDEAARSAVRDALGIAGQTFLIGSVARWHPHKDIPTLLRAIRIAADKAVPLRCLVVGRGLGTDDDELTAAIRETGCEDLVVALGVRSDVPDLVRALDVHVLSSCSEAFPNVVAETMLAGTPNIVTDVGDAASMLGDTGWLVPPRDPGEIADAIDQAYREWADDRARWAQRRANARRRIADNFTFAKMADAYACVWREVAATA